MRGESRKFNRLAYGPDTLWLLNPYQDMASKMCTFRFASWYGIPGLLPSCRAIDSVVYSIVYVC